LTYELTKQTGKPSKFQRLVRERTDLEKKALKNFCCPGKSFDKKKISCDREFGGKLPEIER